MQPAVWLVAGLVLCAAELLTLDLVLLMLGAAALATAGAAVLLPDGALPAQLAVFSASTLVLLLGVRPLARRHLQVQALPSGPDRLRGRTGVVVQDVGEDRGQVRLGGELWRARPYAGGADLPAGTTVVVAQVQGATLHVYPEDLARGPGRAVESGGPS